VVRWAALISLLKSRKLEGKKKETKRCVEELDVRGFIRMVHGFPLMVIVTF
jgi:hypothetical protein